MTVVFVLLGVVLMAAACIGGARAARGWRAGPEREQLVRSGRELGDVIRRSAEPPLERIVGAISRRIGR